MLILFPAVAVVGAWIPPPPGLPTLKIGSDGVATPTTPPEPEATEHKHQSTTTTKTTKETSHVPAPCTKASLYAKDFATKTKPKPTWVPPKGEPAPPLKHQLPVLQYVDPGGAPYLGSCGTSAPSTPGIFYQFGSAFSRDDGLWAINSFCRDMVKQKLVVGTPGQVHPYSPNKAVPIVQQVLHPPGGGPVLHLSAHVDSENANPFGHKCPDNWSYSFFDNSDKAGDGTTKCKQIMSQVRRVLSLVGRLSSL